MDEHTMTILLCLMKHRFEEVRNQFYALTVTEQMLIGNEVNFNIIRKHITDMGAKCKS